MVSLYSATRIYPKVSQSFVWGLLSAESNLVVASLAHCSAIRHIFEGDLFAIRSLCVRKYRIPGNVVANEVLGHPDAASIVAF